MPVLGRFDALRLEWRTSITSRSAPHSGVIEEPPVSVVPCPSPLEIWSTNKIWVAGLVTGDCGGWGKPLSRYIRNTRRESHTESAGTTKPGRTVHSATPAQRRFELNKDYCQLDLEGALHYG